LRLIGHPALRARANLCLLCLDGKVLQLLQVATERTNVAKP